MIFLDTNILIYASGLHGIEDMRTGKARAIVTSPQSFAISVQVLQEFYDRVTRKSRPQHLSHEQAMALVAQWRRFIVHPLALTIFDDAISIKERFGYRYWDCAIIAAAQASECETLYSEDMQHGQRVDSVTIINPFLIA